MDRSTIRIRRSTHALIRALADREGTTMAGIVDRTVRDHHRRLFWAGYHAAYAALQADPVASAEFRREVGAWDATAPDGLEDGPHHRSE